MATSTARHVLVEESGAAHITHVTPAEDMRTVLINNLSGTALLAGVAIGLVTQLLLSMLGVAKARMPAPSR
jgi:hypothetical protein